MAAAALQAETNALPGASNNSFMRQRENAPRWDRATLRMQVDETQAMMDSLARESRGLDAAKTNPLFDSLRDEFHLGKYVGKSRKALKQAEEVLEIQDSIRFQEMQVKNAALNEAPAEDAKLLGLQSDLNGAVESLRDTLRDMHREASEDTTRDLRTWIMVSEGLLRKRREDAASSAGPGQAADPQVLSPAAETPLTYDGAGPQGLSPTAAPSPAPTPAPKTAKP